MSSPFPVEFEVCSPDQEVTGLCTI